MGEKPKIEADDFVSKVVADPSNHPGTVLISGFIGRSTEEGHIRVYSDASLSRYVDIAESDVIHCERLPKEQSSLGGSYLWIRKDAETIIASAAPERRKARFLEGPITAQWARLGAQGAPILYDMEGGEEGDPPSTGDPLMRCNYRVLSRPSTACQTFGCLQTPFGFNIPTPFRAFGPFGY